MSNVIRPSKEMVNLISETKELFQTSVNVSLTDVQATKIIAEMASSRLCELPPPTINFNNLKRRSGKIKF